MLKGQDQSASLYSTDAKQVKFAFYKEHHSTRLGDEKLGWIDPMCADQQTQVSAPVLFDLFEVSLRL